MDRTKPQHVDHPKRRYGVVPTQSQTFVWLDLSIDLPFLIIVGHMQTAVHCCSLAAYKTRHSRTRLIHVFVNARTCIQIELHYYV